MQTARWKYVYNPERYSSRMLAWLADGEDVRATTRIPNESREELRALGYLD